MSQPTTIGLLCSGWTPDTGTEATHTEGLARALQAAGFRVVVLAVDRSYDAPFAVRDTTVAGVHVRRVNVPLESPGRFEDLVRDPRAERVVRDWMIATHPELLHLHHLASFGFGALDAIAHARIPLVITLHDYWPVCARGGLMQPGGARCDRPLPKACAMCIEDTWHRLEVTPEQVAVRNLMALEHLVAADRILVPSEASRAVYQAAGLDPARLEVMPIGLEVQSLILETQRARGDRPHEYRLGVLGGVRPEKGVSDLAHAVAMSNLPGLTLEVHGPLLEDHGDATYRNALRRLADHEPRIRLHGSYARRELPRVLATLDAVALPSNWAEPSALSLREARAVGLPVIATARGAALEFERDPGVHLVEREGVEAWVEALWTINWEPTEPVKGVTLLPATEKLLRLYNQVWAERREAARTA